jgi:cyclic pyranopterin monophosphate synthase
MSKHWNENGEISMVDVSPKSKTHRKAKAKAIINITPEIYKRILNNEIPKGDVLTVAQIAGIMGGKNTSNLIPLCHPVPIEHITIETKLIEDKIILICEATSYGRTGVEMEALTGVSIGALTIYDMLKSFSKSIVIEKILLLEKSGGKSGDYKRK